MCFSYQQFNISALMSDTLTVTILTTTMLRHRHQFITTTERNVETRNYLQLLNEKRADNQLFFSSAVFATSVITGCCRTCNSNAFFSSMNSHQHDLIYFILLKETNKCTLYNIILHVNITGLLQAVCHTV